MKFTCSQYSLIHSHVGVNESGAARSASLLTPPYASSQTAANVCLPEAKAVTENKHR